MDSFQGGDFFFFVTVLILFGKQPIGILLQTACILEIVVVYLPFSFLALVSISSVVLMRRGIKEVLPYPAFHALIDTVQRTQKFIPTIKGSVPSVSLKPRTDPNIALRALCLLSGIPPSRFSQLHFLSTLFQRLR